MSFENREIDDKKLMDEIDGLDTVFETKVKTKKVEKKVEKTEERAEAITKEKSSKYNIAIILLLILVVCAYLCYEKFIKDNYACDDYSYEEYQEMQRKNENEFKNQKTNIETKTSTSNNNIFAKVENNNDTPLNDCDVYIVYYDSNNKAIDVDSKVIEYIVPNGEEYVSFEPQINDFENYDIVVSRKYFAQKTPTDLSTKIGYNVYEEDGKICIKGKNENDKKVDILKFQIVFYDKNGEVIGLDETYEFDLDKNQKFEVYSYGLYDGDSYESIEYENYEVNLIYALER